MRSRRKLTQYAVADLAGINGRHMQAIEGGLENPTISTLTRIALALEVDIRDLFDR
ncbi:MAG: helix-turn-helix transcriptional regulator [Acidobacteria bacterium]|nr:helix-turn-helix transcriptional regulator [Acidobacteriota bacterium]